MHDAWNLTDTHTPIAEKARTTTPTATGTNVNNTPVVIAMKMKFKQRNVTKLNNTTTNAQVFVYMQFCCEGFPFQFL